jgi:hypothetical protein
MQGESVVNKDVTRTIDASTSIVRIVTEVKASDVNDSYDFILPTGLVKKLAFLSVTVKGKALSVSPSTS